jgi:O-antigen/teichoic acid export membrane protein
MKHTFLKLMKHTGIYSISEIASRAVGFLLIPLYTRYLTPADYGVLEIVFTTQAILLIVANQGMGTALFRFWPDYFDEGKIKLASSCLWYELFSAALIAGLGIIFSDSISDLLFNSHIYGYFFRLVFVSMIINLAQIVLMQILRARMESVKVSISSLIKLIVAIVLNIYLLVVMHMGLLSMIISDLVSGIVALIITYWFARRFINFSFATKDVWKLLAFGFPLIGGGLSNWVLSVSDRYFLAHYSTQTEIGLYSLAYRFSSVLSMVMLGPFLTTWPTIYFEAAKRPDGREFLARSARYFALIFCLVGVALSLFSNIAIRALTPAGFWPATRVVYLIAGTVILEGLNAIFVAGLYIENKSRYPAMFFGIAAVANLILNILLIPDMGMIGAAIATLLSYALLVILTYRSAQKYFPVHYPGVRTCATVLAFLSIGYICTAIPSHGILVDSLIAITIILFSALAGFFSPMLTASERKVAVSLFNLIRIEGLSVAIKKLRASE